MIKAIIITKRNLMKILSDIRNSFSSDCPFSSGFLIKHIYEVLIFGMEDVDKELKIKSFFEN